MPVQTWENPVPVLGYIPTYDPYAPPSIRRPSPLGPPPGTPSIGCPSPPGIFYPYNPEGPWYDNLPNCPCSIPLDECGCPTGGTGGGWQDPGWATEAHPGAVWEMRWTSHIPSASGQQCTYDLNGQLITTFPAAGTPDIVGYDPNRPWGRGKWQNVLHGIFDFLPYIFGTSDWYENNWPPNNGNNCPHNSGAHGAVQCTKGR